MAVAHSALRTRKWSEPSTNLPKHSEIRESRGIKNGDTLASFHTPATPKPADPGLADVVRAWPDLPPAIRAGVLALVKAATPTTPPTAPSGPAGGNGGPTAWKGTPDRTHAPTGCGNGRGTGQSLFLQPTGADAPSFPPPEGVEAGTANYWLAGG